MLKKITQQKSTPLRASERRKQKKRNLQRRARFASIILLLVIIAISIIDITFLKSNLVVAKSTTAGAVLNWFAQTLFAWFVFRYANVQATRNIVNQMYFGQIIKWLVTIIGFAGIFICIKPISALAVILGYLLMQAGYFISLWKYR